MWHRLFARADENRIEDGLARTRQGFQSRLAGILGPVDITEDTWEELTEQLVLSDVGVRTATELIGELRAQASRAGIRQASQLGAVLRQAMVRQLSAGSSGVPKARSPQQEDAADGAGVLGAPPVKPLVMLVVGVNGSGKTTTIAKLARWYQRQGQVPLIVAADTYRAAAAEQLAIWADRLGVGLVVGQPGADPGAVAYDALCSRDGRTADAVIMDTAGRLHTQANLMAELGKIRRVIGKATPGAPHEVLLVLDATTGQNGLSQARAFGEAAGVTGIVLAKLDSSAKGGVALAIVRELGVPVCFVGTGEQPDDLAPFDAAAYVAGLVGDLDLPSGTG
jgi:fused signal recognition particle receptor